jgi:hypothetical protein
MNVVRYLLVVLQVSMASCRRPETCRDILIKITTISDIKFDIYIYIYNFMIHGIMNIKLIKLVWKTVGILMQSAH